MLALGNFLIPENIEVGGDKKLRPKTCTFFFTHPSKGKTIVVALPLVLPTSPYSTEAVAKFGQRCNIIQTCLIVNFFSRGQVCNILFAISWIEDCLKLNFQVR